MESGEDGEANGTREGSRGGTELKLSVGSDRLAEKTVRSSVKVHCAKFELGNERRERLHCEKGKGKE